MIPKFRAFIKDEDKVVDVKELSFKYDEVVYESGRYTEVRRFKDVKIMQSTGLKDINGTEIYEGDIVEVLVQDIEPKIMKDKTYVGVVVYKQGTFDIKISKDTYLGIIPTMYMSDIDCTFEILGNAYETPELLEGE
ncbi:YopX family protein [Staphylococcus epidermidis]|nr:YopX family protein [Staphylococcus epidermidis]